MQNVQKPVANHFTGAIKGDAESVQPQNQKEQHRMNATPLLQPTRPVENLIATFYDACTKSDLETAREAASRYFDLRGRYLSHPEENWHVQFSEGGNSPTAEFSGDGTAEFKTEEAADAFVAAFRGAWVGKPFQPAFRFR